MLIRAGGVDIFVKDLGTGTPVLFLHGNPDTADIWTRDFACSFVNLGHFLDELVEGIGIALPLNLVTHDFGGAFGMAWAVQHAEKVRRIVVINHPFFIAGYRWHLWARIWRTPILGELGLLAMN